MSVYYRPQSLREALALLQGTEPLTVLAGATDIYPARATRAAWGARDTRGIVDISDIAALRGIEDRGGHWWLGATTTWTDIIAAELPPVFDGLKAAAREVGGLQIQNRGTIGGNICNASPAADGIPPLLTLDADVECVGGVEFRVPLRMFLTAYRQTALGDGELVTGIRIPKQPGQGHFLKLGARKFLVISIAMVAGVFDLGDDGVVRCARIAIGACSATAQRLHGLETVLAGQRLDPALATAQHLYHLAPINDVRASAAYRKAAALELVRDLIVQASSASRRDA
jgi:CO/xanthine dehydrogenase FAD-binding subunit